MNRELIISEQANERLVKQYSAVKWKHLKLTGWLIVTTERLLFLGGMDVTTTNPYTHTKMTTTTNYIRKEARIENIMGIEGHLGWKHNGPARGKAVFIEIHTSQGTGFSLAGLPAEQTVEMLEELGALIADLKADKEKAYEAWGEPEK